MKHEVKYDMLANLANRELTRLRRHNRNMLSSLKPSSLS